MSPAALPRLLVDVTEYVRSPATAGIQRVLWRLAADWQGDAVDARYGYLASEAHLPGLRRLPFAGKDRQYVTGAIGDLAAVMGSVFRSTNTGLVISAKLVRGPLLAAASETVAVEELHASFDGYLLPVPTLQPDHAAVVAAVSTRLPSFFVYYDALPFTHPQFFPSGFAEHLSPFHRAVTASSNVAFISTATLRIFQRRLVRREVANAIVARPGADGLRPMHRRTSSEPCFTVVGSVEPRKRHALVVDAFERLWSAGRNYRLIVLGAPGWAPPDLIERLRALAQTPRLRWIENPGDDDISAALAGSSALVCVPQAEGYGLPPLEALVAGCPVIVSADLPSLEDLPASGQIRLEHVTVETVANAVEELAAYDANAKYRQATEELRLPTWRQFAEDIEQWIARTIATTVRRASLKGSLA